MTSAIDIVEVDRIACRLEPYDWPFARDEATRIDRHWDDCVLEKPSLFDGRVLLSRSLALPVGERVLRGQSFEVAYKAFLGWRDFGFPGETVHNLFAMPALRSEDGAFMLGRMCMTTANAGRLYFPAGTPEPADAGPDGLVDFDANILRELAEETGLMADDVTLDDHWTIVLAGPLVACMKVARSDLSSRDLVARVGDFIAGQTHPELDALVAIHDESGFDADRMPEFMTAYLRSALGRQAVSSQAR